MATYKTHRDVGALFEPINTVLGIRVKTSCLYGWVKCLHKAVTTVAALNGGVRLLKNETPSLNKN